MEFNETTLYLDAMRVISNTATAPNVKVDYILVTPIEEIEPLYQTNKIVRRDYVDGYADETSVTLAFGAGTYAKRILANRTNLRMRVKKVFTKTLTRTTDDTADTQAMEFTAILADEGQNPTVGQGRESDDEDALNNTQIVEVMFQLIDPAIERLKATYVGGVPRQSTPEQILQMYVVKTVESLKADDKILIDRVQTDTPNNKSKIEQLTIPQKLPVYEIPRFLQSRCGVYSAGLGTFIQNQVWYTYPLFDTTRFNERAQRLTVLVLPKNKFSSIEVTYEIPSENSLTIVTTSETAFRDDAGTQALNHGNGVRFADLEAQDDLIVTKGNKTTIDKSKVSNAFVATKRENGVNYAPAAAVSATANPYQIYSQLSARTGALFKFIWENSQGDLLLPGMAAKVIYFDEKDIQTLDGVVVGVTHVSTNLGGVNSSGTSVNSFVNLFVRPSEAA